MFKDLWATYLVREKERKLRRLQLECDNAEINKLVCEKRAEFAKRDLLAYTQTLQNIYGAKHDADSANFDYFRLNPKADYPK